MTSFSEPGRSSAPARVLPAFVLLCAASAALPWLPRGIGWENGPLENLQVALLVAAAVAALRQRASTGVQAPQQRAFWNAAALLWLLMAARELSWGAVFCTPLHFDALTGPTFSSRHQLWYRPAILPAAGALLLWCLWQFGRARIDRIFSALRRAQALPLAEVALSAVYLAAAASAEQNLDPALAAWFKHRPDHAALQSFEELAELCAYAALVCAQARVARFWRGAVPGTKA